MPTFNLHSDGKVEVKRETETRYEGEILKPVLDDISSQLWFPQLMRVHSGRATINFLISRPPMYQTIYFTDSDRIDAIRHQEKAATYTIPVPWMRYLISFEKGIPGSSTLNLHTFSARTFHGDSEYHYPLPNYIMDMTCDHLEEIRGYVPPSDIGDRCNALIRQFWMNGFNNNLTAVISNASIVTAKNPELRANRFGRRYTSNQEYVSALSELSVSDVIDFYATDPASLKYDRTLDQIIDMRAGYQDDGHVPLDNALIYNRRIVRSNTIADREYTLTEF